MALPENGNAPHIGRLDIMATITHHCTVTLA